MSKQIKPIISDNQLELLLKNNNLAHAPDHFTQTVMASINTSNESQKIKPTWWQWLALIGGGIPALMQTVAFMFSAWSIANIG